jgi:hypothetical protein
MKCTYSNCYNVAEYNYKYYSKSAYCNKHKMVTKSEIFIIL